MSKKLITPQAILSYPHLDEPQLPQNKKGKAKYSVSLIFVTGSDIAAMQAAVIEAAVDKFGQGAVAKLKSAGLKQPFRTDWEAKAYPEGSTFFNARSEQRPGYVYLWADPKTKKPALVIPATIDPTYQLTDADKEKIREVFYPGALVRASVTAFGYDTEGSKGVSFGLNNIQKLGDGPRMDGRKAAEDEFEADASLQPADLSDLE